MKHRKTSGTTRAKLRATSLQTVENSRCPAIAWLLAAHDLSTHEIGTDLGISGEFVSACVRPSSTKRPSVDLYRRILEYLSDQLEVYKAAAEKGFDRYPDTDTIPPAFALLGAFYVAGREILEREQKRVADLEAFEQVRHKPIGQITVKSSEAKP